MLTRHTHIYYMSLKGFMKFKQLRLILVNSQIFNFFMAFLSIVVKFFFLKFLIQVRDSTLT